MDSNNASQILQQLHKQDLQELKAIFKPPQKVLEVFLNVCTLMNEKPSDSIKNNNDKTWIHIKYLTKNPHKFRQKLKEVDRSQVDQNDLDIVKSWLAEESNQPEKISYYSRSAKVLVEWMNELLK